MRRGRMEPSAWKSTCAQRHDGGANARDLPNARYFLLVSKTSKVVTKTSGLKALCKFMKVADDLPAKQHAYIYRHKIAPA